MRYLTVKNFEKFQHYKDRSTFSWIKLYAALLNDDDFGRLPDRSKAHLMLIWLLVSQRNDRRIPDDPRWVAGKLSATEKVDLKILVDEGWLIPLDASLDIPYRTETSLVQEGGGSCSSLLFSSSSLPKNGTTPDPETVSPTELIDGWNEICAPAGLPRVVEKDDPTRLKRVRLRLREHPKVEFWNAVLTRVSRSDFLRGLKPSKDHQHWKADFDWLMGNNKAGIPNCIRTMEGVHDNGKAH